MIDNTIPADYRSGYVALIGKPNVGKSTLLNALLGRKLSIVTHKPQTTRHRVLGILSTEAHQIIFLDTPGIIKPRYKMQESMMHDVHDAIADADLLVFMADATQEDIDTFSLERIGNKPAILVINKMDRIAQIQAVPLVAAYDEAYDFEEIIPISALNGDNLDVLLDAIVQRLPLGPPFYPMDMMSEHPERFFVSEIIREKIFELYRQEIPYSTQVNIVEYEERENERDYIHAEIVVERTTQKGILIGKGGQALKKVGTEARKDIEAFLGKRVYLKLFVKVRDDWRNRDTLLKSYGYRP
ncbi:MAG: GTPase Era [Acidiferrobacterales bacterium]|nr:GTPase Era [Acidiferrobacterales bacterium]